MWTRFDILICCCIITLWRRDMKRSGRVVQGSDSTIWRQAQYDAQHSVPVWLVRSAGCI